MDKIFKLAITLFFIGLASPVLASNQASTSTSEQSDAAAQHELGMKYYNGTEDGTPNIPKAIELWEKSAESGFAPALFDLGIMYKEGHIDGKPNIKAAFDLFEQSAAKGYGPAMVNLGIAYAQGDGVEPDLLKSKKLFEDALKLYTDPKAPYPDREIVVGKLNEMLKTVNDALKG